MIDFTKLIELYISRKDRFVKSDDRAKRRADYFKEISEIEASAEMSQEEKRARKNSAAQKLTGNGLASQELVDYYFRHPDFINFEIIAPIVGFWDQVLIKAIDDDGKITKLELDPKAYRKEVGLASGSLLMTSLFFLLLFNWGSGFINFMANNYYLGKGVVGIAYLVLISPVLMLFMFVFYLLLNLLDLKRLVK